MPVARAQGARLRMEMRLLPVGFCRVEVARVVGHGRRRLAIFKGNGSVEAGASPCVAGGIVTGDGNFQPHGVLISIGAEFLQRLEIARRLALLPDFVSGAAVIVGNAGFERKRQCLRIHMRHHQQLTVPGIRHNGGDEAVGIEFRRERTGSFKLRLICGGGRKCR